MPRLVRLTRLMLFAILRCRVDADGAQHKEIPEGRHTRGKRTIAKELVYRHILARIKAIYSGFNIGVSA